MLGTHGLTDGEGWRGVDGAELARGGHSVVRLGGPGDRRLLDVLAAQVAGAGVDRAGRQDRALGEHHFRDVEPAAIVAVVKVAGSVQAI